ncbi:MAG: zinc ABC transporter substrate-binding protein [Planctomycetes bacterium]|nr:zinc ABC transporter substrate-binding protein [Planctomycetota bacterium]
MAKQRLSGRGGALLGALLCIMAPGCREAERPAVNAAEVRVVAGIPPTAYFVERIGGGHVTVDVLIPAGRSPHSFALTPKQMVGLSRARLFFAVGMPFEKRLAGRIAEVSASIEIVDTSGGIERRRMSASHANANGPDDADGARDPHVWLDPRLAKIIARNICGALQILDPDNAAEFRQNTLALEADLDRLHARLTAALAPHAGARILVFHPAYGYFTDAYGLQQMAVEVEGKAPSGKRLAALIARAKADGVRVIFVQPSGSTSVAGAIAGEIGATVATLDPLAGDYIANMDAMAAAIMAALEDPEG